MWLINNNIIVWLGRLSKLIVYLTNTSHTTATQSLNSMPILFRYQ